MKKLIIDDSFWEMFPEAQFGAVQAHNINNTAEATRSKMGRLKSSLAAGCVQTGKYLALEEVEANKVIKVWVEAYKKFAAPKGAEASVVQLLKTAHEKGEIGSVNALADIVNSDSLIWALPITMLDTDKIKGDLHLGVSPSGDICFYDEEGALSEGWTSRYADRTAVTYDTANILLMINLIDTTRAMELKACLNTLTKQPVSYLGGESSQAILTAASRSWEI